MIENSFSKNKRYILLRYHRWINTGIQIKREHLLDLTQSVGVLQNQVHQWMSLELALDFVSIVLIPSEQCIACRISLVL